jgi:tRNA (Thr-GGU) A37 N-methylase
VLGFDETPATVLRVRPRLISAWNYGVYATRTDWRFGVEP